MLLTSTIYWDWYVDSLQNILYPVIEVSLGSSQVRVTESEVDEARRPVTWAGGWVLGRTVTVLVWVAVLPELSDTVYDIV